jgi:hypothetical protein
MASPKNLLGLKFNRFTPIEMMPKDSNGHRKWLCECDCGEFKIVESSVLISGSTKSCGCYMKEKLRDRSLIHGMSFSTEYGSWAAMKSRCLNLNDPAYSRYGGRGIKVCSRWQDSFENFLSDMGHKPKNTTIDRYPDNNGNYEPANCRWATWKEQNRNRKSNLLILFNGKNQCATAWSEELGIPLHVITTRINAGWSSDDTFNKPIRRQKQWIAK